MARHVWGSSIVGDTVREAPGRRAGRSLLAYGEVQVGPGRLALGVESLGHASAGVRSVCERAVAAVGVDPDDVLVVRISERAIEVDAIDPDDLDWPVRTWRVTSEQLRERVRQGVQANDQSRIDGIDMFRRFED